MFPIVCVQFTFADEGVVANGALERFGLTVAHDVLLEICVLTETFPTNGAKEWTFASVCPQVVLQRRRLMKRL